MDPVPNHRGGILVANLNVFLCNMNGMARHVRGIFGWRRSWKPG
jgi:hypothetical protein